MESWETALRKIADGVFPYQRDCSGHLPEIGYEFGISEFHQGSTTMYVDEGSVKESLIRMIRRITPNVTLREDLLQESLIHLWLTEAHRPGQARSWYLQSCRFHLRNHLGQGRSVDSMKRRHSYPTIVRRLALHG